MKIVIARIKRNLQIIAAISLAVTLFFTQTCYAGSSKRNVNDNMKLIGMTGVGVGVVGAIIAILSGGGSGGNAQPAPGPAPGPTPGPEPIPPEPKPVPEALEGGLPIIQSSSIHNLLSVSGKLASGSIIVLNNSTFIAPKFAISGDVSPIVIDPNSSCFSPVAPGGTCQFNITYSGAATDTQANANPVSLKVINTLPGKENVFDVILVNTINKGINTFYPPYVQETAAKGVVNGNITSFAVINQHGNKFIYIASNGGGVFKTSDAGKTWIPVNAGLTNLSVLTLLSVNGSLYAGTSGGGVFKTSDNGVSWIKIDGGVLTATEVKTMVSFGSDLYAGTNGGGVFKSSDGGTSWTAVNSELSNLNVQSLHIFNGILYAGTNGDGVFKFNVSSANWTKMNAVGIQGLNIQTVHSLNADLYIGTNSGGVFCYNEKSVSWDKVNLGLSKLNVQTLNTINDVLYAGTNDGGVFKFNGESWKVINSGLTSANVKSLFSFNDALYAGTVSGAFVTGDMEKWAQITNDLINSSIRVLYFSTADNFIYAGATGPTGIGYGVFKSNDSGANWTAVNNGLGNTNVNTLYLFGSTLFAGTNNGGVFKTVDSGENWASVTIASGLASNVTSFTSPNGTDLYASTNGNYVYKTSDGGNVWSKTGTGSEAMKSTLALFSFLGKSYAGANTYIGVGAYAGIYREDSVDNWKEVFGLFVPDFLSFSKFMATFTVGGPANGFLYAGALAGASADGGVFTTSTGDSQKDSWKAMNNNNFNYNNVFALAYDSKKYLFAGVFSVYTGILTPVGPGGVYAIDTVKEGKGGVGNSWKPVTEGLTNPSVQALFYDTSSDNLFVGTNGTAALSGGIFKGAMNIDAIVSSNSQEDTSAVPSVSALPSWMSEDNIKSLNKDKDGNEVDGYKKKFVTKDGEEIFVGWEWEH